MWERDTGCAPGPRALRQGMSSWETSFLPLPPYSEDGAYAIGVILCHAGWLSERMCGGGGETLCPQVSYLPTCCWDCGGWDLLTFF